MIPLINILNLWRELFTYILYHTLAIEAGGRCMLRLDFPLATRRVLCHSRAPIEVSLRWNNQMQLTRLTRGGFGTNSQVPILMRTQNSSFVVTFQFGSAKACLYDLGKGDFVGVAAVVKAYSGLGFTIPSWDQVCICVEGWGGVVGWIWGRLRMGGGIRLDRWIWAVGRTSRGQGSCGRVVSRRSRRWGAGAGGLHSWARHWRGGRWHGRCRT